jgi:hypothetical protein
MMIIFGILIVAATLYMYMSLDEETEHDRYRAVYTLFSKLQKAEERAAKEGWIDADDLEEELGVSKMKKLRT